MTTRLSAAAEASALLAKGGEVLTVGQRPASERRTPSLAAAAFVAIASIFALAHASEAKADGWVGGYNTSAQVYGGNQAMQAQSVSIGQVVSIQPVAIKNSNSINGGGVLGALVGAVAGHQIGGSSSAHTAGAVVGGVAGGLIGNNIGRSASGHGAVQLTIAVPRGNNVQMLAIVQDADYPYHPGQPVQLIGSGRNARISPCSDEAMCKEVLDSLNPANRQRQGYNNTGYAQTRVAPAPGTAMAFMDDASARAPRPLPAGYTTARASRAAQIAAANGGDPMVPGETKIIRPDGSIEIVLPPAPPSRSYP